MTLLVGIAVAVLGGWLWHLGGQGKVWARAVAFPALIAITKAVLLWNIWALAYWLVLWLLLAGFSYGLSAPPHKFWVWVFGKGDQGDCFIVELCTRLTCGVAWCSAGVAFAIFCGNWLNFAIYLAGGAILVGIFGMIPKVEISETGTGASVACSIFI